MAVNNIHEKRQVKNYAIALILTCIIVSLTGIAQIPSGGRVSAPFEGEVGEPNTFGGYLVLMLSMTGGLFLTSDSRKLKIALTLIAFLIIIPLLFTLSRSSWIAILPMYIAMTIFSERKKLLIAGIILTLSFGPFMLPSAVKERVLVTTQQQLQKGQLRLGKFKLDTSASARISSWKEALGDWAEHPILGYGVTGYKFLDAQYFKVLIDTGAVGFIAFAMLLGALLRQGIHSFYHVNDNFSKGLSLGFIAGTIAMMTHALASNTFIIVRIMEPYWFFAAMISVIPTLVAEEKYKTEEVAILKVKDLVHEQGDSRALPNISA